MGTTTSKSIQFSANQRKAVWLKFQGHQHAAIAKQIGVSKTTVDAWSCDPAFKEALSDLATDLDAQSRESLIQLRAQSEQGAAQAIAALTQILAKPELKQNEALAASDGLLRWFQALHPQPKEGISVAASASAGDSDAQVVVYIPANDRDPCPGAVPESETWGNTIDITAGRDAIDVFGSSVG